MALRRAKAIRCESCQIFVKNNMQWFGKPYAVHDVQLFRQEYEAAKVSVVFGHAGYLINLAAPDSANRDKSLKSLIQEVEFAAALPREDSGKIFKRKLRTPYWEKAGRSI